jgi:glyoxylase-like metal-dependent hydrolase (beta-lactamase superfamily II)
VLRAPSSDGALLRDAQTATGIVLVAPIALLSGLLGLAAHPPDRRSQRATSLDGAREPVRGTRSRHARPPRYAAAMLVAGFPAGSWGTNCYVVAPAAGEQCVVIDPGQDAVPGIEDLVREHRLRPVAVLLTHGHIDHIWSVVPVCGAHDVPAYIHPADRYMLTDPGRSLGMPAGQNPFGLEFTEPSDVVELTGHDDVTLAGLDFVVDSAPGHTEGSVTFRLGDTALFSGDLVFAGSIGRTDLPGGDYAAMLESLRRVLGPLPDELPILSGHGAATTVGAERATNPYLREAGVAPVARGL